MIKVERLSKNYSGQVAIENVSFEIGAGEIVGLLGLNGAGKSTILKILGCFLMPSAGTASIGGFSIEDDPNKIRSIIGYLPDAPPLYAEMLVRNYLKFVARLKDVESSKIADRVAEAISRTNLEEVADAPIGTLSHGFRQRVGIAQAIVHKPKVLILDEPINGLDPVQIVEMRDLIVSFRKEHTVILSSHILSEITKTCDRILIVDRGHLVAEGNEAQLQSGVSVSQKIICEVSRCDDSLVGALRRLKGVQVLKYAATNNSHMRVEMEAPLEIRPEIAKVMVENDAGLLSMTRQGDGLENLFMKFVRS